MSPNPFNLNLYWVSVTQAYTVLIRSEGLRNVQTQYYSVEGATALIPVGLIVLWKLERHLLFPSCLLQWVLWCPSLLESLSSRWVLVQILHIYIYVTLRSASQFLFLLVLVDGVLLTDEDEGEAFDFDDICDDVPEADRLPPAPPSPLAPSSKDQSLGNTMASPPEAHISCLDHAAPFLTTYTAAPSANQTDLTCRPSIAGGAMAEGEGADDAGADLPPPPPPSPPPSVDDNTEANPGRAGLCIDKRVDILHFRLICTTLS